MPRDGKRRRKTLEGREAEIKVRPALQSHTLYGAVAGQYTSSHRAAKFTANFRDPVLTPDEALWQSTDAPTRYHEKDIYFAHEDLPQGGQGILPDSDLLTAMQRYASQFYEALAVRARQSPAWQRQLQEMQTERKEKGQKDKKESPDVYFPARLIDERSMDETALLAFGILLEEAGREVLGARGDLVFTEADCDWEGDAESEKATESLAEGEAEEAEEREESEGDTADMTGATEPAKKRNKRRKLSAKWVDPADDDD